MAEGKSVLVAVSGGVDSSVAAALALRAGHEVHGAFIRGWHPAWMPCTWEEERYDAMRVCATLGIPFETVDLSHEYHEEVVRYMLDGYRSGETPNPDVACNRYIKFGAFLRHARARGADYIATGHHARVAQQTTHNPQPTTNDSKVSSIAGYRLLTGVDGAKDQSYFLWTLSQEVLAHTLFPIGEYTKDAVRALAQDFGLHTATKRDSQGLCFVGKLDVRAFLRRSLEVSAGAVLDTNGSVVGTHEGAALYTIGQRHGFSVTERGLEIGPWYVVAKDVGRNTITVSALLEERVRHGIQVAQLREVNWITQPPSVGKRYDARFRYRQPLQPCTLEREASGWRITFDARQPGVAPGQSCVVYDRAACLGGGVLY